MKATTVTYIVSDIGKALAFEWIATYLDTEKFALSFVLVNPVNDNLRDFLHQLQIPVTVVSCKGKKDWPRTWWSIFRYLKKSKPQIVHCHLLTANILGLTAAKFVGIGKRIYTRHHSSLHHRYHPKGIIWDRLANRLATDIISISGNVTSILTEWEKVPRSKIHEVPHGFVFDYFREVSPERVRTFKDKYGIQTGPIVGVISRFTEWKGIQYIIPAFEKLRITYPDAVLLLLNAKGDYEAELRTLLVALPRESYRTIAFEPDIAAALHSMDLFVHAPIDSHSEAFGQIYIEALAAEIPSVFTLSGIATDFIRHERNALVVPFQDSESIYTAMQKILYDSDLMAELKKQGWDDVKSRFGIQNMVGKLDDIYRR